MFKDIFDIESFNIISDEENYYFFRALNMGDNADIENNITTDINGNIITIRTDRERYDKEAKYNEDSSLTLEEIFDHIKMHHRKDTNCISLTSNANVALMYGRGYYKDKYVIIKIPKKDYGDKVINAGFYMMQEINRIIQNILEKENNEIFDYFMHIIDNCKSQAALDSTIEFIKTYLEEQSIDKDIFEKGIEYKVQNTTSVYYPALNKEQNLEKNKLIAKIDVLSMLKKQVLNNVSNKFLIQTIGNAFSSLEFTHYNEITKENILELPKEYMDIIALLQQLNNIPYKDEVIKILLNSKVEIQSFPYQNYEIDAISDYTIEKMYNLTYGNVDYQTTCELYKKSFYLAKSKLRTNYYINILKSILGNDPKYDLLYYELRKNTYGIEPLIFSRTYTNKFKVSETVNLDIRNSERELIDFMNSVSVITLEQLINNPKGILNYYLNNFKEIKYQNVSKDVYYANAIIDLFDWSKLDIVNFSSSQRNDIVNELLKHNVVLLYETLKNNNIKESDIANVLLTIIIKDKKLNDIDLKDNFTVEQLEEFLGYYKVKGTKSLTLRSYQATALTNIDKSFETKNFTAAILPTGAGKSFVALAEMLQHKDEDILYLAPNDEILNQIKKYICKYIYEPEHCKTLRKKEEEIIKEVFPNLKLETYASVNHLVNEKYSFMIFDELHRTGAYVWNYHINKLLDNQDDFVKVLGITATPERDVDYLNMADEWAKYFGYTEEEILKRSHLAINMDLDEAIRLGYVVNPKVVECEYSIKKDGSLERLRERIELIQDEEQKTKAIRKFDEIRRKVETAEGIEKVLGDNIKMGGKYIVFCPVMNNGNIIEDFDGYLENDRLLGDEVLDKYENEIILDLAKYYNLSVEEVKEKLSFSRMLGEYSKTKNKIQLQNFEKSNPNKINFMFVINKLNEGVHVKDVDGIIWYRALDENSKILFLQQFGRIIYGIDPNEELSDEKRPIAIDLTGNLLRVKLKKDKSNTSDLDRFKLIHGWIRQRNGKIPDLNSLDKVEACYGSSLKRIKEKYISYIQNEEFLLSLN